MDNRTLKISLLLMSVSGNTPEKGYSKSQIALFLANILGGFTVVYLIILKLVTEEEPLTIKNSKEHIAGSFLFIHKFPKSGSKDQFIESQLLDTSFKGIVDATGLFLNKSRVMRLINGMKGFWKIENLESEQYKRIIEEGNRTIQKTFNCTIFLHILTVSGFLVVPVFLKGEVLPFESYIPEWLGYYPVLIFQQLVSLDTILLPILAMDYFFMVLVHLTQTQFKLLNKKIESVFDIDNPEEPGKIIKQNIKECVEFHNFLLKSDWETIRNGMIYCASINADFMLCYCFPSQKLMDEIAEIANSAYRSRWYDHPSYARDVKNIIQRGQKPVAIEAGKLCVLDMKTGLSTIRTMVSYAMFLRTMGADTTDES
ncbi:hypothetical protein JTB14_009864 [Gonioctena quinquepunctata]|nr:hypothetical protein JTB14_009864 [Gonioctena quinquepunctata]